MNLQVAAVDAIVVGHDYRGELDVLVAEGLKGSVELADDEIQATQRLVLQLLEGLAKLVANLLHRR
jgi:hypothetical protein